MIHFWGAGTFFYSFTAFFNPIVDEFGWTYTAISFAASLRSIEGGIASPLVGFAADRYGARRLLLIGSILGGFGFILFGQINSIWTFYLVFIFLSIGLSLVFPVPGWTAVANWFEKKRGMAMGLLSAAIGASGLLVYFVNWLIGSYGWRSTLVIIGIGMWVIGIPFSLIVRHSPEPYGLIPDGERSEEPPLKSPSKEEGTGISGGFSVREALKTRAFWFIAMTMTLSGATVHAVMVHMMPYLISIDFGREKASLVASLVVFVSVCGRFGSGWLSSRISTRYLLVFGLLLQGMGLFVLAVTQNFWQAIMFVILFGPGYGGVITIRLAIQAEYFGRKAFGAIQGIIMGIVCIGTMSSPLLTGLVYDLYGSYFLAWFVMAIAVFAAIFFALQIRPPHGQQRS
jgi:sugar phosphate permease